MTRHGALLVFKPGTTLEQAAAALKGLEAVLDPDYFIPLSQRFMATANPVVATDGNKVLTHVESFDDRFGGPVFYIP